MDSNRARPMDEVNRRMTGASGPRICNLAALLMLCLATGLMGSMAVQAQEISTITVILDAVPDDDQDFEFTTSGAPLPASFLLDDDEGFAGSPDPGTLQNAWTSDPVPAGATYSIAQTPVTGWNLSSATCDNGNPPNAIVPDPGINVTCTFVNEPDPGSVTVTKFVETGAGTAWSFDIAVDPVDPGVTAPQTLSGTGSGSGVVTFEPLTLNQTYTILEPAIPEGWTQAVFTCSVADNEPAAPDYQVTITEPGQTIACDIVNRNEPGATFLVTKDFDDDNPAEVEVTLSCNTGLPLEQTTTIAEGDGVNFVIGDFKSGELDCEVNEVVPEGYQQSYHATGASASTSGETACMFTGVEDGHENSCVITNALLPVDVMVNKEWVDERPEFQLPTLVEIRLRCENGEIVNGFGCGADSCADAFIDPGNPGQFLVFPHWDGSTLCSATETPEAGVLQNTEDCGVMPLAPGQGDECTIVNTRLFAGIPTLGGHGLVLLALLLLGMGVLGIRRLA